MANYNIYDPRFAIMNKNVRNGTNSVAMAQENRNLVIQLIRRYKRISRKQIAEYSGLNLATVTNIIKELLEQGVVREDGVMDGGSGRRVTAFALSRDIYMIAVRITRAYVDVALVDVGMNMRYVKKHFFETEDTVAEGIGLIEAETREIEKLVDKRGIIALMVGLGANYVFVDGAYCALRQESGEIVNIGSVLHDALGYRTIVNRAVNYMMFEIWHSYCKRTGRRDEYTTLMCLQISYDMESAIMVNHEILYGKSGLSGQAKNLVSPMTGKTYGEMCSVPALLRRAEELRAQYPDSCVFVPEKRNIRDLIRGYDENDPLCVQVWQEFIENICPLLVVILEFVDPDAVILMDEVPYTESFMQKLNEELRKHTSAEQAGRVINFINRADQRKTENDPSLRGAARCAFDLMITQVGMLDL